LKADEPKVQEQEQQRAPTGSAQVKNDTGQEKLANPRESRTIRFVLLALLVIAAIVSIPVYAYELGHFQRWSLINRIAISTESELRVSHLVISGCEFGCSVFNP
jgi:hypothetical protein